MNKIEVKILNPPVIYESEKMMVTAARLTQRGHKIHNMEDFLALYEKPYANETAKAMCKLPHPTIQKFGAINVVVVGASRRFLAQITRHQNEVKFMSASLQYSDYTGAADFVVPYALLGTPNEEEYLVECSDAMVNYAAAIEGGLDNDSAGYIAPQSLRNVLIISATPYQWKHMIGQRTCRRNTTETRYVMLRIWEALYRVNPVLFDPSTTGPFCQQTSCKEGKMSCGKCVRPEQTPTEILREDFPKLYTEAQK